MKKIITGMLLVLILVGCTGCVMMYQAAGELVNEITQETDTREVVQTWYDHVEETASLEEAGDYFYSENSAEYNQNLYNQIKEKGNINVTSAEILDAQDNHEAVLFHYTVRESGAEEWGFLMYRPNGEQGYVLYQNDTVLQNIIDNHVCGNCGGSGQIPSGNDLACAICGGTGQQYIPNLYYDAVMGWTGGYTGCSGCGGSGYISGGYAICNMCEGCGIL